MEDTIKIRHPFGIPIAAVTRDEFIAQVIAWGKSKTKTRLITYLNAHCVNIYFRDKEYADIIQSADLVYADGQSVVWASRLLGEGLPERISAGDFMTGFCVSCVRNGVSLYFLGSSEAVAERAASAFREQYPGLEIAGTHQGFFTGEQIPEILDEIKKVSPDILLLGMGAPLQEKFARKYAGEIEAPVIWCVGALFEYFAKVTPHAPLFMRRAGLEWLFRLITNPRRFWKRYFIGNATFALTTLRRLFKK
ncbi:WecB/TagA/CpsF family glycosyltransferase [Candidatus Sumerlaeota bacterium]|nr:WecB/TagA/CpsF family glycosyltransferase [Candidatus Sumerlaeota bacterium]